MILYLETELIENFPYVTIRITEEIFEDLKEKFCKEDDYISFPFPGIKDVLIYSSSTGCVIRDPAMIVILTLYFKDKGLL